MSDSAILNAMSERTKLLAKIAESEARTRRLKAQLTEINSFISQWEKFSGVPAPSSKVTERSILQPDSSQNGTDSPSEVTERTQNSKKEEVAAVAREILETAPMPISRSELYRQLSLLGLRMNGTNPEMVLSTMLWRAGRDQGVIRLKSGGYWLEGRELPLNDSVDATRSPDETEGNED